MGPSGSDDSRLNTAKALHAGHYDQLRYLWCDNGNVIRAKTLFLPTFLARHGQEEALDCLGHLEDAVTITAALQALPPKQESPPPAQGADPDLAEQAKAVVRDLLTKDPDEAAESLAQFMGRALTPREAVAATSRALVAAVAAPDRSALETLLAPDARATIRGLGDAVPRPQILGGVDTLHAIARVRSARVLDTRVGITGPAAARAYIRVRLDADALPRDSWWEVSFALRPDASSPGLSSPDQSRPDARTNPNAWQAGSIRPHWIQGVRTP